MIWPMPILAGNRSPVISNDFHPPKHTGVDIMYRAIPSDEPWPGKDNETRSKNFWCGRGIDCLAYRDGKVMVVKTGKTGTSILISHSDGSRSLYCHLIDPTVKEGQSVKEEDRIGTVGGDPNDSPGHLIHLHFEVWEGQGQSTAIDPEQVLKGGYARLVQKPKTSNGSIIGAILLIGGFLAAIFGGKKK